MHFLFLLANEGVSNRQITLTAIVTAVAAVLRRWSARGRCCLQGERASLLLWVYGPS